MSVVVSSDLFTYNAKTKTFVCEMSDLPKEDGPYGVFDAIHIRSARTGRIASFGYNSAQRNKENEVESFQYIHWSSDLGTYYMTVLND